MNNNDIELHLASSIEKNLIYLHYQPKVNINSGEICGSEALIRVPLLNGRNVPADRLIHLAEKNGTILDVGKIVLRKACKDIVNMTKNGVYKPVSVNVSVAQILDLDFYNAFVSILTEFGIHDKTELIEIEITESLMINDPKTVVDVLNKLNSFGVRISLDDFGMGFSSLNQLKMLPVDSIKIDKSFVDNVVFDNKDMAIVRLFVSLSKEFSIGVLAEGVERPEQAAWLKENGCYMVQGYLYGKPMSLNEFIELCKEKK